MPEFMQLMEGAKDWAGFAPVSQNINEAAAARLIDLMANTRRLPAHRADYLFREAITTSDFPSLFGFTLERAMLARYLAAVPDWQAYTKLGTMPNFNAGELHKVMGNDTLLPEVAEKGEYLVGPVAAGYYTRRVKKWGRQFDISWEAIVNDALDAFGDVANRMADSVTFTRAYNVTDLIASVGGPDALLFGAGLADTADGQLITNVGALPLSIANLDATLALMAAQTDINGRPLGIRGKHLVVPPALEMRARQILTSAYVSYTNVVAAVVAMPTSNVIPQMGLQLHVNPLLPVIDASGNRNFTWYLFADPSDGVAIQLDLLRGQEAPEICMKASDKVGVGGAGPLSPFSGDFATDNIFYRVRDVHGGTRVDRRYCYAQVNNA